MVGIIFVYVDTAFGIYGYSFLMLSWMFQHDYLDTCCFECFIRMCFVFLSLHLLSERHSGNPLIIIIIIIMIIIMMMMMMMMMMMIITITIMRWTCSRQWRFATRGLLLCSDNIEDTH